MRREKPRELVQLKIFHYWIKSLKQFSLKQKAKDYQNKKNTIIRLQQIYITLKSISTITRTPSGL